MLNNFEKTKLQTDKKKKEKQTRKKRKERKEKKKRRRKEEKKKKEEKKNIDKGFRPCEARKRRDRDFKEFRNLDSNQT